MNFSVIRFAIIAVAHVAAVGIVYLLSSLGGEGGETATAGANGLVTWSSQEANANRQVVDSSAGMPFDSRAGDLSGYNAGDPLPASMVAQRASSNRPRFEPTRPSSGGSEEDTDNGLLRPVNPPQEQAPLKPIRSRPSTPLPPYIQYTVQRGDSLWGISEKYNVSIAEIESANPGLSAPNLRVGMEIRIPRSQGQPVADVATPQPEKPQVQGMTYLVRPGDSLSRIAAKQGTTVSALKAANGLRSNVIRVGQELVIPNAVQKPGLASQQWTGRKVVVKPGDTLSKIAASYDVSVRELMELNSIRNARLIRIGQTILIPGSGSRSPSPAQSTPVQRSAQPTTETPERSERSEPSQPESVDPEPVLPEEPLLDIEEDAGLIPEDELIEEPIIPIEE